MNVLVTGGAGFIGSHLIRKLLSESECQITNIDKLSYAANRASLKEFESAERYQFFHRDLCDFPDLPALLHERHINTVFHLAAETHVDRSINSPEEFIKSNVVGTQRLLESVKQYLDGSPSLKSGFRLIHVSTDEVFGSLGPNDPPFHEEANYRPNSPYSASKAASDHLVRAWNKSFGIPTIISHCSNNYGPQQFPEKLIPVVISRCLEGKEIPVYGEGANIRDWIYVLDHCDALIELASQGVAGESYVVGAGNEWSNLQLVNKLCKLLDKIRPRQDGHSYTEQIVFVKDRPGHDFRYAIDPSKIIESTGWRCRHRFDESLELTVQWFVDQREWLHLSQTTRLGNPTDVD